jgi:hypothetical protein
MKKLVFVLALATAATAALAGTAFLKSETITGMTKQCVYDYLGSTYTRTVKSYDICPVTVQVN